MENASVSKQNLTDAVPLCDEAGKHVAEATKALMEATEDTIESAIAHLDSALMCLRQC
jgi:hypothetical protein